MRATIYLDVSYTEKDEVKTLGAKWDSEVKKWFFSGEVREFSKFTRWIKATLIVYECFHIIEASRICFKCKKKTRVIGFGIGEHSHIEEDDDDNIIVSNPTDYSEMDSEIYLAWTDDEKNIPPLLLKHIQNTYSVKTGYSRIAGNSFSNHCDHCGTIQGNWHLFDEDSPLNTMTPDETTLVRRMADLKIYNIYIDSALAVNWDVRYCSNDWAYQEYCNNFVDLDLTGDDDYISYHEMYQLQTHSKVKTQIKIKNNSHPG